MPDEQLPLTRNDASTPNEQYLLDYLEVIHVDDEQAGPVGAAIDLRQHGCARADDHVVRAIGESDQHLLAVEDVLVAVLLVARRDVQRVRPAFGSVIPMKKFRSPFAMARR